MDGNGRGYEGRNKQQLDPHSEEIDTLYSDIMSTLNRPTFSENPVTASSSSQHQPNSSVSYQQYAEPPSYGGPPPSINGQGNVEYPDEKRLGLSQLGYPVSNGGGSSVHGGGMIAENGRSVSQPGHNAGPSSSSDHGSYSSNLQHSYSSGYQQPQQRPLPTVPRPLPMMPSASPPSQQQQQRGPPPPLPPITTSGTSFPTRGLPSVPRKLPQPPPVPPPPSTAPYGGTSAYPVYNSQTVPLTKPNLPYDPSQGPPQMLLDGYTPSLPYLQQQPQPLPPLPVVTNPPAIPQTYNGTPQLSSVPSHVLPIPPPPLPHSSSSFTSVQPPGHTPSPGFSDTTNVAELIDSRRSSSVSSRPARSFLDDHEGSSDLYRTPSVASSISHHQQQQSSAYPASQGKQLYDPGYGVGGPSHLYATASSSSSNQHNQQYQDEEPGQSTVTQDTARLLKLELQGRFGDPDEDDLDSEMNEEDERAAMLRFFTPALLSNIAVQLKDRVNRNEHIKGSIPFARSFTGRDVVTAIQSFMPAHVRVNDQDRRAALEVGRSLKSQLFFTEVDFDDNPLTDSLDDVFMFMDESEGDGAAGFVELPTGVLTLLTKCYSPSCIGDGKCYSPRCPYTVQVDSLLSRQHSTTSVIEPRQRKRTWAEAVDPDVLVSLSASAIRRQEAIHTTILSEEQYHEDLMTIETLFILPLRAADPPIISPPEKLETLIRQVFGNIGEIRAANERCLELFSVRQREERPVIQGIGDIFLHMAADFRDIYPAYLAKLPIGEKALQDMMDQNPEFRLFVERAAHVPEARQRDLKRFLGRPVAQLNRYTKLFDAIQKETPSDMIDAEFIAEASSTISKFAIEGKLLGFQSGDGRGVYEGMTWEDITTPEERELIDKNVQRRQHVIFEIIKGEIQYVTDLQSIQEMYVTPLRQAKPPIIGSDRIDRFIDEVFHNFQEIRKIHVELLARMCKRQVDQHPTVGSVTDLVYDALLNWTDAYREYASNYPKAKWKIDRERMNNPAFDTFFQDQTRNRLANRRDMHDFINRPIPRLLRYILLLQEVTKIVEKDNGDTTELKAVTEELQAFASSCDKVVAEAQIKVKMWGLKDLLTVSSDSKLSDTTVSDLELLDPIRQLIHEGQLRQPDGVSVFVILFDNYLVTTKAMRIKEGKKDAGQMRYVIQKRPIPLELLTLGDFSGQLTHSKSAGLIPMRRDKDQSGIPENDSKIVYPFIYTVKGSGVMGGQYVLWAESDADRSTWKTKLEHAKALREVVSDSNKVFEIGVVSKGTLFKSSAYTPPTARTAEASTFSGQVTCSVPFRTSDKRELIAIGCEEGVWIGMKGHVTSFSKVLHVKNVMQCAVLEDFSMFLVLADHSLFAYQLEALVPSSTSAAHPSRGPERLSGTANVLFFSVGQLAGRTLVAYMKKKQMDSVFRVLEPIPVDARADSGRRMFGVGSRSGGTSFRVFKDFFIPSDAKLIHFLKAKMAIVCAKGFEIMDLSNLQGGTIPIFFPQKVKENSAVAALARRCDNAQPLGMYRSTESEFLLVYNTFGFYVQQHGEPSRDYKPIEWETRPNSVAFHPPHFMLFSWNFIEVRHIHNGKLVQIIAGNDIRCVWDGSGVNKTHSETQGLMKGTESLTTEPRVHVVSDDPSAAGAGKKGIAQMVYELQPTILLDDPLAPISYGAQQHNMNLAGSSLDRNPSFASTTITSSASVYNAQPYSNVPPFINTPVPPRQGAYGSISAPYPAMSAPAPSLTQNTTLNGLVNQSLYPSIQTSQSSQSMYGGYVGGPPQLHSQQQQYQPSYPHQPQQASQGYDQDGYSNGWR